MGDLPSEIIVDLFAGGGGASTALFNATGRHPDVAVNHNAIALAVHAANHPTTRHLACDIREVDPVRACTGDDGRVRPIAVLWASPDCTHFSKARGGKPVEKGIRSLANVVLDWIDALAPHGAHPRAIFLENVEEFQDWGPVLESGKPCPENKGLDFRRWRKGLEARGYKVEHRELVAADYGAPTTRKRLKLVARRDGLPIVWPEPTRHSRKSIEKSPLFGSAMTPWRAAAEIIDWSLPCPSIFERKRPLQPKTRARIAKGIKRYVVEAARPFIVPLTHTQGGNNAFDSADPLRTIITTAKGGEFALAAPTVLPVTHAGSADRVYDPRDPFRTITAAHRGELAVAAPVITNLAHGDHARGAGLRAHSPTEPFRTIHAQGGSQAVAVPVLVPRYGEREGQEPRALDAGEPYPTVVPTGNGGDLGAAFLTKFSENSIGTDPRGPLHTAMAGAPRHGVVSAFVGRQFGTAIGRDAAEPLGTVMSDGAGGKSQIVAAHLGRQFGRSVGSDAEEPMGTVTAGGGGKSQVVAASMVQSNGDRVGRSADEPLTTLTHRCTQQSVMAASLDAYYATGVPASADEPLRTATAKARHGLTAAFLEQANTGVVGHAATEPLSTILAAGCHQRLIETGMVPAGEAPTTGRGAVLAFLWEHFGEPTESEWADPLATPQARLRFGLVLLDGVAWQIVDIGMRMLTPRELFNAQGFPTDYVIEVTLAGKRTTKTAQTAMAGNSVSPPPAEALLRANLTWMHLPIRLAA